MIQKLPKDMAEFFQQTGRLGGKIGGKRSLETMTPEERTGRAKKAAAASAEARRKRGNERLPSTSRKPAGSRSPTPTPAGAILRGWRTKQEVLLVADQVLSGFVRVRSQGESETEGFLPE